jgi:NAD(P)-dependent dehydrogenase (short-subunit alcohol dehydrogenase family)
VRRTSGTIATLRFRPRDQRSFARLSGDFNPVHLDPDVARRIVAGEPIVHGMHLLLRALEAHFTSMTPLSRLAISATFLRPAVLGEPIRVERHSVDPVGLDLTTGVTVARATIEPLPPTTAKPVPAAGRSPAARCTATIPVVRTFSDVAGAKGAIALPRAASIRKAFPRAARALGADAVGSMTAISRLVGMECPGRDSLLSSVRLDVTPRAHTRQLSWNVARADRRFGLVRIDVRSGALCGTVDAFLRRQPAPAPAAARIKERITSNEFAGQRALVIGGSRGLGAATALMIAAGGGLALITYATGANEAKTLQREARAASVAIDVLRFDVLDMPVKRLAGAAARFGVTHLYYYATPRIFVPRREPFDDRLFERFAAFYVTGFARVCGAVRHAVPSLTVFYPSTTAIDEGVRDLTEYAAAKSAGESVCRQLPLADPALRIVVRRLARVSTDQTASILAAGSLDPIDALLPILRSMHGHTGVEQR